MPWAHSPLYAVPGTQEGGWPPRERPGQFSEGRELSEVWLIFRSPASNITLGTNRPLITIDIYFFMNDT